MIQPANQQTPTIHVMTCGVQAELTPEEIAWVHQELMEKMKTPDPDNPNLWTTKIRGQTIWGILDEGAGPNGEDLFSLLFPHEY